MPVKSTAVLASCMQFFYGACKLHESDKRLYFVSC